MTFKQYVILMLTVFVLIIVTFAVPAKQSGDPNSALPWLRPTGTFSEQAPAKVQNVTRDGTYHDIVNRGEKPADVSEPKVE